MADLYTEIINAGLPIDSHESDLYVLASRQAWTLIKASGRTFSTFVSQIDGKVWYDVPFAYTPWWERRKGSGT